MPGSSFCSPPSNTTSHQAWEVETKYKVIILSGMHTVVRWSQLCYLHSALFLKTIRLFVTTLLVTRMVRHARMIKMTLNMLPRIAMYYLTLYYAYTMFTSHKWTESTPCVLFTMKNKQTRLSCFNVKTNWFMWNKRLVRLGYLGQVS